MKISVGSARVAVALGLATIKLLAAGCGGESACTSGDPACGVHPVVTPTVQSVSITGDPGPLRVGQTAQLTATVAVSGGASQAVTWSSSNASVVSVTGGTISAIAPGTATITATSQADASKSSVLSATVIGVSSVSISPSTAQQLETGQTSAQLTAAVTAFGGAATTVAWSSSNTAVATVSATGSTATVKGVSAGTTTITVASTVDVTKLATVAVTVTAARTLTDWTRTVVTSLDVVLTGTLNAIWESSTTDVYAVTSDGEIARHNGVAWQKVLTGKGFFGGVFGNGPNDIFAVGLSSTGTSSIWHFDGGAWAAQSAPGSARLWSVWSAGPTVAFAVGDLGTILRYDGASWSALSSPTTQSLYSVWGLTATNVYAVGDGGTILHYDGASWTAMVSGQTGALLGVWASGPTNVFAVGQAGVILHFTGTSWSTMPTGTTQNLTYIHGSSATQVSAVGSAGTLLTFDGTSWTPSMLLVGSLGFSLTSVWDAGPAGAFVGGPTGLAIMASGDAPTLLSYNLTLTSVAGAAGNAYVTDDLGGIYRFDGTQWFSSTNGSPMRMYSISPPFAVGDLGTVVRLGGNVWSMEQTPFPRFAGPKLNGVAARSPTSAIAVGDAGTIIKLTGSTWATQASGTTASLRAVWFSADGATAYAVGLNGTILRYDGTTWTRMASPTTATLLAVWSPIATNLTSVPNVYVAALDGSILVNTAGGTTWSVMRAPTNIGLTSLWGTGPTDVLATGESGTILHFDGVSWTPVQSGVSAALISVGGFAGLGALAVGRSATALHASPIGSVSILAAANVRRRVTIARGAPSHVIYPDVAPSIERGSTLPRTPR